LARLYNFLFLSFDGLISNKYEEKLDLISNKENENTQGIILHLLNGEKSDNTK